MAKENCVSMSHYSYRVEFQCRGMPHVHVVTWINDNIVSPYRHSQFEYDNEKLPELIDKLITCHLPDNNESSS